MNHAADIELLAAENSRRMSLLTTELDEIKQRTTANDRDCTAQRTSAHQQQRSPEVRNRPTATWTEAVTRSRTARRSEEVVTPTDDDDDPYYRRKSWLV